MENAGSVSIVKKWRIPDLLSFSRIPVAVLIFFLLASPSRINLAVSAGLFLLASISDWLDGFLARKYNAGSLLGAVLDNTTDKPLVYVCLLLLFPFPFSALMAALLRDSLIGGLRWYAGLLRVNISVKYSGKAKTFLTMLLILIVMIWKILNLPWEEFLLQIFSWVIIILTAISGVEYLISGWHVIFPSIES